MAIVLLLLLAATPDGAASRPEARPEPLAVSAAAAPQDAGAPTGPRTLIADSRSLVLSANAADAPTTLSEAEARITRDVNRVRGTWQSYRLYTDPGRPEKFFHPGFTFTLGPRRESRKPAAASPAVPGP